LEANVARDAQVASRRRQLQRRHARRTAARDRALQEGRWRAAEEKAEKLALIEAGRLERVEAIRLQKEHAQAKALSIAANRAEERGFALEYEAAMRRKDEERVANLQAMANRQTQLMAVGGHGLPDKRVEKPADQARAKRYQEEKTAADAAKTEAAQKERQRRVAEQAAALELQIAARKESERTQRSKESHHAQELSGHSRQAAAREKKQTAMKHAAAKQLQRDQLEMAANRRLELREERLFMNMTERKLNASLLAQVT
jgi:hypothetical protein